MDDLAFIRPDLEALSAYFHGLERPTDTTWSITHNLFFRTEAGRDLAERALEACALHTSYVDQTDDPERPFWLDMMEHVPPSLREIEENIVRVLAVLAIYDGEYNSFFLIGDRGESFP